MKDVLDSANRGKKNNTLDILIAETAIRLGVTLVTDDAKLRAVVQQFGGAAISVIEFANSGPLRAT